MKCYKAETIQSMLDISADELENLVNGGHVEQVILPQGLVRYSLARLARRIAPNRADYSFHAKQERLLSLLKKAGGTLTINDVKVGLSGASEARQAVINELVRKGAIRVHQRELPPGEKHHGRPPTLVSLTENKPDPLSEALEGPSSEVSP